GCCCASRRASVPTKHSNQPSWNSDRRSDRRRWRSATLVDSSLDNQPEPAAALQHAGGGVSAGKAGSLGVPDAAVLLRDLSGERAIGVTDDDRPETCGQRGKVVA